MADLHAQPVETACQHVVHAGHSATHLLQQNTQHTVSLTRVALCDSVVVNSCIPTSVSIIAGG